MTENEFLGLPPDTSSVSSYRRWIVPMAKQKRVLFFIGVPALVFIFYALFQIFMPLSRNAPEDVPFEIAKGESVGAVSERLAEKNIIRSPFFFNLTARLRGVTKNIQAGVYTIRSDISINALVTLFSSNMSSNEITITIPEGWTTKDIAQYLQEKGIVQAADFLRAAEKDYSSDFEFLKNISRKNTGFSPLEGYVFPDTYRIFKDATPEDIIRVMLRNFDRKFSPELRTETSSQKKSIHQIITMASIIEREVRKPEDKALVSGILWKRLDLGIPLQADASVVYLKTDGRSRTAIDKVFLDDLKIDSPYNTYKYRGLPPGPLSNPGLESIRAALYPQSSPYFYYLSASDDGTTIFSRTLEEHNANKAKYLK